MRTVAYRGLYRHPPSFGTYLQDDELESGIFIKLVENQIDKDMEDDMETGTV